MKAGTERRRAPGTFWRKNHTDPVNCTQELKKKKKNESMSTKMKHRIPKTEKGK